jgi:hypothetical protein
LCLQKTIGGSTRYQIFPGPGSPIKQASSNACQSFPQSIGSKLPSTLQQHRGTESLEPTLDKLLLVSFADFKLHWPAPVTGEAPRLATGRENGDWITKMLVSGITINGTTYHFFGHSNSQLKSRSCFMYAASKQELSTKVEAMGDLSKIKSVGKKAKRIGLLFSSAEVTLDLSPDRCQDIDDVATKDYIFTDGCGLISTQLARQLAQKRNIVFRDRRYLPSVYQVRYRGYKGVLTLDPTLRGQTQAQFRASMRKFTDSPDYSFAVVDYSKVCAWLQSSSIHSVLT